MANSPSLDALCVLAIKVVIDKVDMPDNSSLVSVVTSDSISGIHTATLTFLNDAQEKLDACIISDSTIFNTGNNVEVYVGYDAPDAKIFRGSIIKQSLEINEQQNYFHVFCQSKSPTKSLQIPETLDQVSLMVTEEDLIDLLCEFNDEKKSTHPFITRSDMQGKMQFIGSADAVPGSAIELRGLGVRFSGFILVNSVNHQISLGNWVTEVQF